MSTRFNYLIFCLLIAACSTPKKSIVQLSNGESNVLDSLLKNHPEFFASILKNKQDVNVQVIYTQINRDVNNIPSFTDYTFNIDQQQYFYPASTVKMPIALLALQKLNELNISGLDRTTSMITDSSYFGEQKVLTDPLSVDGKPGIEQYIKEIFLLSDNNAFNRLYEFLGQEYINTQLHNKGYNNAEILHRLSVPLSEEQNRHTNAVAFYDTASNIIYQQPAQYNHNSYSKRNTLLGKGYYKGGSLVNQPFDFSKKNRLCLPDLHNILRSVIFPETIPANQRFNLTQADYTFLYKSMSPLPRESKSPVYDTADYWDAYVKFLLYGSEKGTLPGHIRIFNKVGDAYGFLTDVAYIVDFKSNTEFILSATILCNSDGIFNDDHYDYEKVGFPFMKHLGEVVYQYELHRKKAYLPDLGKFKFDYND